MQWCDEFNLGISHFGLPPQIFNRHNTRFDIFHQRGSITRRLMMYLRRFIMLQSEEVMSSFSTLLDTFWRPYLVEIWNLNKPLASYKGMEILEFIRHIPDVIDFLSENFEGMETIEIFS